MSNEAAAAEGAAALAAEETAALAAEETVTLAAEETAALTATQEMGVEAAQAAQASWFINLEMIASWFTSYLEEEPVFAGNCKYVVVYRLTVRSCV